MPCIVSKPHWITSAGNLKSGERDTSKLAPTILTRILASKNSLAPIMR